MILVTNFTNIKDTKQGKKIAKMAKLNILNILIQAWYQILLLIKLLILVKK